MKTKQKKILNSILNVYTIIGFVIILFGTLLLLSPIYPYIFYQVNDQALTNEQNNVSTFAEVLHNDRPAQRVEDTNTLPPIDTSLTKTNTLLIPSIKVIGQIHENSSSKKGLNLGVWKVPEWGTPLSNQSPIILAAHRFGYLTWSNKFREQNSFYNLPKTKVGDRIEIIWNQRRFIYKIYKTQEDVKIADYKANLILYTCKTYNSDIRVFRYAKRVN